MPTRAKNNLVAGLLCLASPAWSANVDPAVSVKVEPSAARIGTDLVVTTFTVTNGARAYSVIRVDCTMLNADRHPIASSTGFLNSVGPREIVSGHTFFRVAKGARQARVACRVVGTY
jgi:hypothetical protein